ncbi:hypothetical protein IT403_01210 [Candidatus Nomurabacteria bacterium]|nr:hypothetical protein [Candidatus Nomurabacteria bacterium]
MEKMNVEQKKNISESQEKNSSISKMKNILLATLISGSFSVSGQELQSPNEKNLDSLNTEIEGKVNTISFDQNLINGYQLDKDGFEKINWNNSGSFFEKSLLHVFVKNKDNSIFFANNLKESDTIATISDYKINKLDSALNSYITSHTDWGFTSANSAPTRLSEEDTMSIKENHGHLVSLQIPLEILSSTQIDDELKGKFTTTGYLVGNETFEKLNQIVLKIQKERNGKWDENKVRTLAIEYKNILFKSFQTTVIKQ